jgi:hypothetical protein
LKGLELVVMFFDILITISIDREKRSDDMWWLCIFQSKANYTFFQ